MRLRALVLVVTLGPGGAWALPAHAADEVTCGTVITASAQLTHDLDCASGDGLTIGASGTEGEPVVLDLGGFTISGDGTGGRVGVRIDSQHHVVVRNGSIAGFDRGVDVLQSMRVGVSGLTVNAVDRGINVGGGGYHTIERNTVTASGRDGIRLGATTNTLVTRNTVQDANWGISIGGYTTRNFVELNTVTGSARHGIGAFDNVRGVAIVRNVVTNNADGIFVGKEVEEAHLESNEAVGNRGDGIHVDTSSVTMLNNLAHGNQSMDVRTEDDPD